MNKPTLFRFEDGKLVSAGNANIEYQTPQQYVESTPLESLETNHWGNTVVELVRLREEKTDKFSYFAIIQHLVVKDSRWIPDPRWALVAIPDGKLKEFQDKFRSFCENEDRD